MAPLSVCSKNCPPHRSVVLRIRERSDATADHNHGVNPSHQGQTRGRKKKSHVGGFWGFDPNRSSIDGTMTRSGPVFSPFERNDWINWILFAFRDQSAVSRRKDGRFPDFPALPIERYRRIILFHRFGGVWHVRRCRTELARVPEGGLLIGWADSFFELKQKID